MNDIDTLSTDVHHQMLMTMNTASDQEPLIDGLEDDPPTYQDATSPGYGTFISPSYPHVYSSEPPQPPTVIYYGDCPACHVGMLDSNFTCLGLCCAICCFPFGIICCLALKERRCNFCGAVRD